MVKHFEEIFLREINKLKTELTLYKDEKNIWLTSHQVTNSAGTLFLHLIGNLNHFIGAQLGGTGYIRERDKEFSDRNIPRQIILKNLEEVIKTVEITFSKLKNEDLEKNFPVNTFGENRTIHFALIQLISHLDYHLGQINYHRRLLES